MTPLKFRRATTDDLPFFFSATLQSHYYSSRNNLHLLPSVYYPEHKRILEAILGNPKTELLIACLEEDPGVIIGFALTTDNILHYVYVKRVFRRFGIARQLLEHAQCSLDHCLISHWTDDASEIWRKKRFNAAFNPYVLRFSMGYVQPKILAGAS